ncbi:MAG: NUDIX hydrolase [Candidatus Kerfeldbacteria bacterium]|nr:NUDIX hydrolase [Candidatus Kerfeldbacteria bacterium]
MIIREAAANPVGTNMNKYDVVGGRVEPGERWDETLLREVQEETGLHVTIGRPFYVGEWRPVVHGEPWQIIATFFLVQAASDKVTLSRDHDDYQWIDPKKFRDYPLIENLKPAFEAYNQIGTEGRGGG